MSNNSIQSLFKQVAPNFEAHDMLARLHKVFAALDEAVLQVRIEEFLKFMFLRSQYGKGFIPLIGDVDDIWHEFILQTQAYEKFCLALPGGKFIHHNSVHLEEFATGQDKKAVIKDLLLWLPRYQKHFGDFTEAAAQYWIMVSFLRQELKLSLAEINALAQQAQKEFS